jgi:hypothetical protein
MRKGARKPRAKRTVVPPYDPVDLARAIESASNRPTHAPPFDPNAYARIVDATVIAASSMQPLPPVTARDTPKTMQAAAVAPAAPTAPISDGHRAATDPHGVDALARAMYASYLESNFPEALVLAEHVVEKQPDHALAQAVVTRCKAVLGDDAQQPRLEPSSVVRLKPGVAAEALGVDGRSLVVLAHVDGVIDAATVAQLAGMSRVETLEHLHALLDEGILEVVA